MVIHSIKPNPSDLIFHNQSWDAQEHRIHSCFIQTKIHISKNLHLLKRLPIDLSQMDLLAAH